MMCDRCHTPITEDEAYETIDIPRPTGAGTTVYLHRPLCQKAPHQSAPAARDRRRR